VVYSWSPGGQTNTTITVKPSSTTTYYITVRDTIGHCFKEDSVTVTVNPIPVASITGNTYICNGNSTTLTASGGNSYLWSNGATNSIITVSPSSLTSYSVYVTQNGCTDSAYTSVFVNPLPVITACCDTSIMAGQSVQLTSSGGATYSWSPSSGLSCNNCPNPIASPNNTTTYILTVTSDSGCFSSETITVDVTCGQVFVPEAFSPNGDGQNDILYVRGDCIKTMQFDVFDRWGNKVFATDDKSIGWNGTYKGQPMNTGSYSYVVTATMFDGSNMIKKGSVALVR
jgi:gliding motility-associated-like protein